jgi:hypothetical protein
MASSQAMSDTASQYARAHERRASLNGLAIAWVALLIGVPTALGWTYAVYNIDSHHWGFVAATALDVVQGKRLFLDTYIQYGAGQPLLYWLLNPVLRVDYTMPGLVTSVVYSLTLVLIFAAVSQRTNRIYGFAASAAALLVHTYAIYPWPDYYAGLFLGCATLVLLGKGDTHAVRRNAALAGGFLFLAFLFRNTYVITFAAATLAYGSASALRPHVRDRSAAFTLLALWGLMAAYLGMLWMQGVWPLWLAQTLGYGSSLYAISIPESVWQLAGRAFLLTDVDAHLPARLGCSILLYGGVIFILRALWYESRDGVLVLLALLGVAGLSQVALRYEVFRLQNACVVLYPVVAALAHSQRDRFRTGRRKVILCLISGCYLALLLFRFPHASSLHPIIENPDAPYVESAIPLFHRHRFTAGDAERYHHLSSLLCDGRSRIANMTPDATIPYLCSGQPNALGLPFFIEGLMLPTDAKHLDEIQRGILRPDELLVTDVLPPKNHESPWKEIGQVVRPLRREVRPPVLHVLQAVSAR